MTSSVATASQQLLNTLPTLSIAELEALVAKHNALYWDKAAPEIDDPTFDKLVEALRHKAPQSPVLDDLGESKKKPRAGRGQSFGSVTHKHAMLSLDKCYDDATLLKWADSIKAGGVMVTPKIDGLACSLRYDASGKLKLAATRGDGKAGDDITQNAKGVIDIPHTLKTLPGKAIEVRGEVYMRLSRFNAHYGEKAGGDKSNPRNLAAGAIKTKDPQESAAYQLTFFAYDVKDADTTSERDKMALLAKLGFQTLPHRYIEDKASLPQVFREFVDVCKALDTETDGVVMKADLQAEHERLGATAHHPRYAIAYKFQGESALSVIRDIEWSISRTGSVNPVAIVDPIFISGVTVTRVSLHNLGYAQKLGAGIGAQVEVVRRGGVIPHVERVLSAPPTLITPPKSVASPSGDIDVLIDGDFLRLKHPERSPEVVVGRVQHFTSMIDATGFGEKLLAQLVEQGLVKTPADLYRLDKKTLMALPRMGDTSAQKLLDVMAAHRELPLATLLVALGIHDMGKTVAEQIADAYPTMDEVRSLDETTLSAMHGIGPNVAASVVSGLHANAALIDDLLQHVTVQAKQAQSDNGHALFGKSVVFTGAMAKLDRKSAQKRVLAVGGKTPAGVSAELDYLVIGDEGSPLLDAAGEKSSKHKSADKLIAKGAALTIMSETDFLKLLGP